MKAFVAGATGYVGSAVVRLSRELGIETHAHIRPDSSRLQSYQARFSDLGASVDTTPWDEDAMAKRLGELEPELLFCCLGTTRARKSEAEHPELETYEAVDYGLTALLVRACLDAGIRPRVVYISAAGTGPKTPSAYMQARWRAESYISHSGLPYTLVRPGFITGPNREEDRPGEKYGAKVAEVALGAAALIGFVGFRNRYAPMDDVELATAMLKWGVDPEGENQIIEGKKLRNCALPDLPAA